MSRVIAMENMIYRLTERMKNMEGDNQALKVRYHVCPFTGELNARHGNQSNLMTVKFINKFLLHFKCPDGCQTL